MFYSRGGMSDRQFFLASQNEYIIIVDAWLKYGDQKYEPPSRGCGDIVRQWREESFPASVGQSTRAPSRIRTGCLLVGSGFVGFD